MLCSSRSLSDVSDLGDRKMKVARVGSLTIAKALRAWIAGREVYDLSVLLADMSEWRRGMPMPSSFVLYLDLACLLIWESKQLAFSSVELVNAFGSLHNELLAEGRLLFPSKEPVPVAARRYAGVLVNGLARFRDLRHAAKRNAVLSKANHSLLAFCDKLACVLITINEGRACVH